MDATLIDEIADAYPVHPIRPADFGVTVMEFADRKGIRKDMAQALIEKAFESGALERMQMREENKPGVRFVYYRPGAWPPVNKD